MVDEAKSLGADAPTNETQQTTDTPPAPERRASLARAARTVIARDGLAAATTRAIVAEAGMPLASFHYAVASRDELLREVWKYPDAPNTRSVDHAIARLRKKIEPNPADPTFIHTIHGDGYYLTPTDRA